ncbi:HNH endonuclease [Vibrio fluvialis]|nr:HNH endonuclease [Vibrio fluvialis]
MRPVIRSAWPINSKGERLVYKDYGSFFSHLIDAFGNYCSYCEQMTKLDVEHVVPKSRDEGLKLEWTNFLLGCSSCNRDFKKNKNLDRNGYLWPDEVDTFKAFDYLSNGDVKVKTGFADANKAQAILDLCNLAPPPKDKIKTPNDYLWFQRAATWVIAERERDLYQNKIRSEADIAYLAALVGYWSVWVSVFNGYPDVIKAISALYTGTHNDYLL